jgi:branched-chain amino acid transport system ATP-binding protein
MSGTLTARNIYTAYERTDVLSGVSIEVAAGSITCILGSNGAGKSTLIRSILRLTPPRSGSISFNGKSIDHLETHQIVKLGLSCIPEGRRIFAKMTVEENLRTGAFRIRSEREVRSRIERIYEMFPRLRERSHQLAGTMSGGEQAMVSIGRGLITEPELLVIDEPSLGLSPLFVQENFELIRRINASGVTVLLVEQNVNQTLAIAHYGYVLSQGKIAVQGKASDLLADAEVQKAYFGVTH